MVSIKEMFTQVTFCSIKHSNHVPSRTVNEVVTKEQSGIFCRRNFPSPASFVKSSFAWKMLRIGIIFVFAIFYSYSLVTHVAEKLPLTKFASNLLRLKDSLNSRINQMCFVNGSSGDDDLSDNSDSWNVSLKFGNNMTDKIFLMRFPLKTGLKVVIDDYIRSPEQPSDLCEQLELCPTVPAWMVEKEKMKEHVQDIKRNTFDATYERAIKKLPQPYDKPIIIDLKVLIEHVGLVDEVHQEISVNLITFTNWTLDWPSCLFSYRSLIARKVKQLAEGFLPGTLLTDDALKNWENMWRIQNYTSDMATSTSFKLDESQFPIFWMPDIILGNARKTYWPIESLSTQVLEVFILAKATNATKEWGEHDREIPECGLKLTRKFTADVACDMYLKEFPIDVQKCNLFFRSFMYSPRKLKLRIINATNLRSDLGDQELYVDTETLPRAYSIPGVGQRASVKVILQFRRRMMAVFVGDMIPALLVVIICFTSFWLGLEGINDRLTVGMNCLFALLVKYDQIRTSLPAISYLTYMDYFMILCVTAVNSQMLHTVVLAIYYRYELKQAEKKKSRLKSERVKRFQGLAKTTESRPEREKATRFKGLTKTIEFVVAVKRARKKPKKRIVYQEDLNRIRMEQDHAKRPMIYTIGSLIAEKIEALRVLILEPSVTKDKVEYGPMKFDLIFRFLIPFVFVNLFVEYFILLLLKQRAS